MEHGDQLISREVIWMSKEAACKDLQRKVSSRLRKTKSIKDSAALSPSKRENVCGKSTSSSCNAAGTFTAVRSRSRNDGLCSRKAAGLSGGVRRILAKSRRDHRQDQRIVRDSQQRLQIGIDSPEQRPKVVVMPKECMKPLAHRDLIIAMRDRPGPHPATELLVRLHHDHGHSAFG